MAYLHPKLPRKLLRQDPYLHEKVIFRHLHGKRQEDGFGNQTALQRHNQQEQYLKIARNLAQS
jgi:hypothetical protein